MSELKQDQYWMQQAMNLLNEDFIRQNQIQMLVCDCQRYQVIGEGFHPKAGQPHAEVLHYVKLVSKHKVQPLM